MYLQSHQYKTAGNIRMCTSRNTYVRVMWVSVTTAWRVLGLWKQETASRYGG